MTDHRVQLSEIAGGTTCPSPVYDRKGQHLLQDPVFLIDKKPSWNTALAATRFNLQNLVGQYGLKMTQETLQSP